MTVWLAVGDEAGNWDDVDRDDSPTGRRLAVALVAAPLNVWRDLQYEAMGKRLCRPLPLPERYCRGKDADRHHVMPALRWLRDTGRTGEWSLDEPPDAAPPPERQLWEHLTWLAGERRFVTCGAWEALAKVRVRHGGGDAAQALGVAYGHLAAMLLPFLGTDAELLVAPGPRSEPPASLPRQRAAFHSEAVVDQRIHGDHRGLVSRAQDAAQAACSRLRWDASRLKFGTLRYLLQSRRPRTDYGLASAVADLGAALVCAAHFPDYAVRFDAARLAERGVCALRFDTLMGS